MTPRERMLAALRLEKPDVLPVTTHHVQPYYLKNAQQGSTIPAFFDKFGFDAVTWVLNQLPDKARGEYHDPGQAVLGFLETPVVVSENWQVQREKIADGQYETTRYRIKTPKKELTMVLQGNEYTTWVAEHLLKEKTDIEVLGQYLPMPLADVALSHRAREATGERGIVRTHVPNATDLYGQPGCWQDACTMFGTQELIMEVFDDPYWVHQLLSMIQKRKANYLASMAGAAYDLIELGGGDGCTSVISPGIFDEFVAPYDKALIDVAHAAGQRIVYHLCGSKMALVDSIAHMGMDALETLTPSTMGGDCDLRAIKRKLGGKLCLIGGFDQNYYFANATSEETRAAVRACFDDAGEGGGYILAPSDHFFEAKDELLAAFVGEAHNMRYV